MGLHRRGFLRAAAAVSVPLVAGCSDAIERTPTDTVTPAPVPGDASGPIVTPGSNTVLVGARGDPGFDPSRLRVPAGTRVRWVWMSDGHDVDVVDRPADADWSGTELGRLFDEGSVHRHRFDVPGRYEYRCTGHRRSEVRGTLLVAPDEEPLVSVGSGGTTAVDSPRLRVAPGTSVTWFWEHAAGPLVVERGPSDADWDGTDAEGEAHDGGHVHRHTFEVPGAYRYRVGREEAATDPAWVLVGDATPDTPTG
jgi:plastocyanin